ncbi:S26 family signal peptidase [Haloarcula montana]|uniref:S26 family signal peptidase n=1 Tax=Haloarcula montana TaxID=3111776 RepID=UPI002D793654|nr:S26 family signal peptidase [Haloarcula sp. GH36]
MDGTDSHPVSADTDDPERIAYVLDILSSVGSVLLVGALLFAISGVWPPLVAVESSSMDPNIQQSDMVFVMSEQRFAGEQATNGVVTAQQADRYTRFSGSGDVIVYEPNGNERRTPVIHRAQLWVEADENWYDRADEDAVGTADNCRELRNCPAPHAGFITKGDNERTNGAYDQASGISGVVRPEWVVGTAEIRIPLLGEIRLRWNQAGRTVALT